MGGCGSSRGKQLVELQQENHLLKQQLVRAQCDTKKSEAQRMELEAQLQVRHAVDFQSFARTHTDPSVGKQWVKEYHTLMTQTRAELLDDLKTKCATFRLEWDETDIHQVLFDLFASIVATNQRNLVSLRSALCNLFPGKVLPEDLWSLWLYHLLDSSPSALPKEPPEQLAQFHARLQPTLLPFVRKCRTLFWKLLLANFSFEFNPERNPRWFLSNEADVPISVPFVPLFPCLVSAQHHTLCESGCILVAPPHVAIPVK